MALKLASDSDDLAVAHEINVTPFIDVMLVLLIIFMVAAPLATVDVKVDLPVSNAPPAAKPDSPVYLSLAADGTVSVGCRFCAEARGEAPACRPDACHAPEAHLGPQRLTNADSLTILPPSVAHSVPFRVDTRDFVTRDSHGELVAGRARILGTHDGVHPGHLSAHDRRVGALRARQRGTALFLDGQCRGAIHG